MKSRAITLFLIGLLFCGSSAFSQGHSVITLSGRVLDAENDAPIANANMFLSYTMLGAATDQNGEFSIPRVPLGTQQLVISCIGYEIQRISLRLTTAKDRSYEIKLAPKVLEAPAVNIYSTQPVEWKKQLQEFEKLFLGTSRNAAKTRIVNPEVLDFKIDNAANQFSAEASDILHIENRALGYRIFYLLESFSFHNEIVKYTGSAKFEHLTPQNEKEAKQWLRNRDRTHRGSLRHFLAALASEQVKNAGFLVYKMPELQEDIYTAELQEVNLKNLLSAGELPFERNLHFFECLQVVYSKEMEEQEYIYWRLNYDKSAMHMNTQKRHESLRPHAQTSWIVMNKTFATFDTAGYLYDPLAVTVYGYWGWQSVADLLPYEYSPHNKSNED